MIKAEKMKVGIIEWLLDGYLGFDVARDSIGLEVLFSRNRRRADMLIVLNEFHALEIKGDLDNLSKLPGQLNDYSNTFDKTSMVITTKHLKNTRQLLPRYTGIILFEKNSLRIIRKATLRKRLDKDSLLMFMGKVQLGTLLKIKNVAKYSTDELRFMASEKLSLLLIRREAYGFLRRKHKKRFGLFLRDTGSSGLTDDLSSLYGDVGNTNG